MYVCWDVYQDTYLDIWVGRVIIIKCQDNDLLCCSTNLDIPLVSPQLLSSGFTSDFRFYDYYHISCSYPALSTVFYSTSLLFLSYYTMSSFCLISLVIYLPSYACLCSRHGFQIHAYDSILSIHVYLSWHAIWHSYHHTLGEFWLLWILMSRSWSLELGDSLGGWPKRCSGSLDLQQTIWSSILPGPLCASWVFLL